MWSSRWLCSWLSVGYCHLSHLSSHVTWSATGKNICKNKMISSLSQQPAVIDVSCSQLNSEAHSPLSQSCYWESTWSDREDPATTDWQHGKRQDCQLQNLASAMIETSVLRPNSTFASLQLLDILIDVKSVCSTVSTWGKSGKFCMLLSSRKTI